MLDSIYMAFALHYLIIIYIVSTVTSSVIVSTLKRMKIWQNDLWIDNNSPTFWIGLLCFYRNVCIYLNIDFYAQHLQLYLAFNSDNIAPLFLFKAPSLKHLLKSFYLSIRNINMKRFSQKRSLALKDQNSQCRKQVIKHKWC